MARSHFRHHAFYLQHMPLSKKKTFHAHLDVHICLCDIHWKGKSLKCIYVNINEKRCQYGFAHSRLVIVKIVGHETDCSTTYTFSDSTMSWTIIFYPDRKCQPYPALSLLLLKITLSNLLTKHLPQLNTCISVDAYTCLHTVYKYVHAFALIAIPCCICIEIDIYRRAVITSTDSAESLS